MITVEDSRTKSGEEYKHTPYEVTAGRAFEKLVVFELGYGGRVIDVTKSMIKVRTVVMSCVDVTTFTGSVEEMSPLITFCAAFMEAMGDKTIANRLKNAVADKVIAETGGVPLLVVNLGPIMMGNASVRTSIASFLTDETQIQTVVNMDLKELVAYLHLALDSKMKFSDVLRSV